jgi:hypothetical protein
MSVSGLTWIPRYPKPAGGTESFTKVLLPICEATLAALNSGSPGRPGVTDLGHRPIISADERQTPVLRSNHDSSGL